MGRAQIIDGGADGRYTIQVDYGSAQRQALIDAFNSLIARLDVRIAEIEVEMAEKQAEAEESQTTLKDEVDRQITALQGNGGTSGGNLTATDGTKLQDFLRQQLIRLTADKQRNQLRLDALRFERAEAVQKIAALNSAQPLVTKQAWCTTLTEDATGTVATIDINGESNLTLIAPEGRTWQAADGVMTMPHVMSPEQSFLNTAILPGWQRHKPKYRWGTIGNIDVDANTCDVSLAAATSSAQNLPINRFTNLTGIPVQYLTCNAAAFADGDRVVVQFTETLPGQFDAKVIGFLDNPKPCRKVDLFYRWRAFFAPPPGFVTYPLQLLFADQQIIGRQIEPYTAPARVFSSAPNPGVFLGWLDGVTTRLRNDGAATEDGLDVTAAYLVMPIGVQAVIKTRFVEERETTGSVPNPVTGGTTIFFRSRITETISIEWDGVNGEGALSDIPAISLGSVVGPWFESSGEAPLDPVPEPYETRSYQGYRVGMPATITRSISYTPGGDLPAQTVVATYSDTTPQSGNYTQTNIVRL